MAAWWGQGTHISNLAEGTHSRAPVVVFFPSHVLCQAVGGEGIVYTQKIGGPFLSTCPTHSSPALVTTFA